jgi:hypothetical protein
MTPTPQEDGEDRTDPGGEPLDGGDAARQVAHLTGMTPDSAATFAAFHSGLYAHSDAFRRAA